MSGLGNCEANDSWRTKLKSFLLAERKPDDVQHVEFEITDRFSLDIAEDLQNSHNTAETLGRSDDRGDYSSTTTTTTTATTTRTTTILMDECSIYHHREDNDGPTDISFTMLEKMCDKTASDPDSTLFHYLHNSKEKASEDEKSPKKEDRHSEIKCSEMTMLENIEAPSALWENTILGEGSCTRLQTSPVKMVGLLRPSTIIEEGGDESGDTEFHSQNTMSQQTLSTAATSLTYETANEFANVSDSNMFLQRIPKEEMPEVDLNDSIIEVEDDDEEEEDCVVVDEDKDAIGEKNFSGLLKSYQDFSIKKEDVKAESGIEAFPYIDDESYTLETGEGLLPTPPVTKAPEREKILVHPNYSMISDLSLGDVELIPSVIKPSEPEKPNADPEEDNSMHFNDTMEEVEYMMRKGLEFMTENNLPGLAHAQSHQKLAPPTPLKDTTHSVVNTPRSGKKEPTPSKTNFNVNIKPVPKLNIFKKPSGIPTYLRDKQAKPFQHVVSPVGAYMKRTAVTPLMSNVKLPSGDQKSTIHRNLFEQSRFDVSRSNVENEKPAIPSATRTLPKKAYTSSEFKHIVDERTKITIPGGDKLRKYIEPAMLPSVVRHEGKIKVGGNSPRKPEYSGRDSTLADLSTMSGDVSVYTVMDAQKFK